MPRPGITRVTVVDSHTECEPTRVVIAGGPDLGKGPIHARRALFSSRYDWFRSAIINEPRGSDVLVGALLLPPTCPDASAAVVFFNNAGTLGMCGHGTIGLVATLKWLGRIGTGLHQIETPVGNVATDLHEDGTVSVRNVESYRLAANVRLEVDGYGPITGDVAWGGNWFYLVHGCGEALDLGRADELTLFTSRIRDALARAGVTGTEGAEIDHIELSGPPKRDDADSRNFVLCPGGAYDRSPCGTGTSARMACLYADGLLMPGQIWRQESITGSLFEGSVIGTQRGVLPTVRGRAWITSEAELIINDADPWRWGLPSPRAHRSG